MRIKFFRIEMHLPVIYIAHISTKFTQEHQFLCPKDQNLLADCVKVLYFQPVSF